MTIQEDVFAALTAGSPTPIRVYYTDELPQNLALPAMVFGFVGGDEDFHLQGRSGLIIDVIQLDAYAGTRLAADALMKQAEDLMCSAAAFSVSKISRTSAPRFEPETRRYRASRELTLFAQVP